MYLNSEPGVRNLQTFTGSFKDFVIVELKRDIYSKGGALISMLFTHFSLIEKSGANPIKTNVIFEKIK